MANIIYRASTAAPVPGSTTIKASPLTTAELDGNLKSLNDDTAARASATGQVLTGAPVFPNDDFNLTTNNLPEILPSFTFDFQNSESVDRRITITRSGLSSRVNEDGLIQEVAAHEPRIDYNPVTKACRGLLLEEGRDNKLNRDLSVWSYVGTSRLKGIKSPTGHFEDSSLIVGNAGVTSRQSIYTTANLLINTTYVFSAFVKAAGATTCGIFFDNVSFSEGAYPGSGVVANLSTGTATSTAFSGIDNYGGGWYRLWVKATTVAAINNCILQIFIGSDPNATTDGLDRNGIIVFGPQLEVGNRPTSYIPENQSFTGRASVATYVASTGLIAYAPAGVARYTYSPNNLQLPPKLLLEGSIQNKFTYTEDLTQAVVTGAGSISSNTVVSPDGSQNADTFTEDTSTTQHLLSKTVGETIAIGDFFTLSTFVKAGTRTQVALTAQGEGYSVFDLITGKVIQTGNNVCYIEPYKNGWYRIAITLKKTNTTDNFFILTWNGANSFLGEGKTIHLWGLQLEKSKVLSSYISCTASKETRQADTFTSTIPAVRAADSYKFNGELFNRLFNKTEGTVHCRFTYNQSTWQESGAATHSPGIWNLGALDESYSGYSLFTNQAAASNPLQFYYRFRITTPVGVAYGVTPTISLATASGIQYNTACSYNESTKTMMASVNGSGTTSTNLNISSNTIQVLHLGKQNGGGNDIRLINGHIQRLSYYATSLPINTLNALTAQ